MKASDIGWGVAATALVAALAGGGWWWWQREQGSPPVPSGPPTRLASAPAPAPSAPASAAAPAIRYPIEAVQPASGPATVPTLAQSDRVLADALAAMVGRKAATSQLQADGLVRRLVVTVDNLARAHAAPRLWPVNPTPGRFTVERRGDAQVIGADNGMRYTPFVLFAESVDVDALAKLYGRLYPLFQQAYEDLGYPGKYFNDRLIGVIDHLLETPEPSGPVGVRLVDVQGPEKLSHPWLHYDFTDPALQSLSAGQKLLVRVGPVNERRLKARLVALRKALTGETR
jgi:hypothetical protein